MSAFLSCLQAVGSVLTLTALLHMRAQVSSGQANWVPPPKEDAVLCNFMFIFFKYSTVPSALWMDAAEVDFFFFHTVFVSVCKSGAEWSTLTFFFSRLEHTN